MHFYEKSAKLELNFANTIKYNIILITQFYIDNNINRYNEIKFCLNKNIQNQYISKIILLNERLYSTDELGIVTDKIIQINISKRLEYSDIFEYITNNNIVGYIVFANSDIYLDNSINLLHYTKLDQEKIMILLLKNDDNHNNTSYKILDPRCDSQDTWIFHSNNNINQIKALKFYFGKPGCDNVFCYLCKILGYTLINCPTIIITHHVHTINIRHYNENDRLIYPYMFLEPIEIESCSEYHKFNIKESYNFTKYNFNENNSLKLYIENKIINNEAFIIPNIDFDSILFYIIYKIKDNSINKDLISYLNYLLSDMKLPINLLNEYSDLYLSVFTNCEIFAIYEPWNFNINILLAQNFIKENFSNKNNIWNGVYNIYNFIHYDPWTLSLQNKKILLLTDKQELNENHINLRNHIYGIDLFPNCKFIFLKINNNYENLIIQLIKTINYIKNIINDFDIALIDTKYNGNLYCNEIYKCNKSAINIGNVLNIYFGLYDDNFLKDYKIILDIYQNKYWNKIDKNII